ncbi:SH3 domain-containing protein [Fructilactobacillus hinvesii]|uniref:SH3 domain-containing protein n=1 Tax=Fructilactobacillus hinvesii TaxID=2940300 RepID=A0ABY5BVJ4_9LACO|nr:SH3 domain-containing protein [Fructilactobacillus hinvesii]USS87996.1 SH3 domain-containing protein [Fructilactobacillus hinvesii]
MKKYAKAHNKMALATGETKTRAKLTKSKHGWLKIAMGLTFASTALFAVGNPTHADVQSSAPVAVATAQTTNDQKTNDQPTQATADEQTASQSATTAEQKQTADAKPVATDQTPAATTDQTGTAQATELAAPNADDSKAATQTDSKADQSAAQDVKSATTTSKQASNGATSKTTDQKVATADQPDAKASASVAKETNDQPVAPAADQIATTQKEEKTTVAPAQASVATKADAQPVATDQQDKLQATDAKQVQSADQAQATTATAKINEQTKTDDEARSENQQKDVRLVNLAVQGAAQNLSTDNMTKEAGSYTPSAEQNVRDTPSLAGNITGQLQAGDTINYDGKVQADGYTWLHYTNYESKDRWVAQLASATTSHTDFINSLSAGALETWKKYGVLPSISISQAIVESAWGQAAPGNNLFGIKGSYNGQSVTVQTQEWINGHYVTIQDHFRAYPSFAESIQDHGAFLYQNSRYANLLGNRDYSQVAWMLQNDGYATSPTYANTLINVIQSNNLSRFDQNLDNPSTVPTNPDNNSTKVVAANGTWTFNSDVNLRNTPSLSGTIVGTGYTGQQIHYDGLADNDGYTWMRFKGSNGAYQYAAQIGPNADVPATNPETNNQPNTDNNQDHGNTNQGDSNQANNNGSTTQESGSYTLSGTQNVRDNASLSAGITGQLQAGDTIYYNGTREADGYKWLHYDNYAGQARWVADLNSANQTPAEPTPAPTPTPEPNNNNNNNQATNQERGSYTLSGTQNVRNDASLSAGVTGQLQAGDTIYYDGTRDSDGYKWLHYNNYAGQDRWVADLNSTSQPEAQPTPAPSENKQTTNNDQESGSYTLSGTQNVRNDASLSAGVTGQLQAGDTIYYNGTREADGYKWLHYDNYAGQARWVADLNGGSQATAAPVPTTPANNDSGDGATVKVNGTYTVHYEQNVRTDASLSAGVTGQLQAGDTINYDAIKEANGYKWLHYINFAGADRWIAQL